MNEFTKLGLDADIIRSVSFDTPTEIQKAATPHILQKTDVLATSPTGSGKTFAFSAGIIQNMKRGERALVLTPTRELAEQVFIAMKQFAKLKKLKVCAVYGGVSMGPQFEKLETSDIVVGTPGRLLDHLERGSLDLSKTKYVVLDEADRMLDMGFLPDVKTIISNCPKERQTLLFSATMAGPILEISKKFMNNPVKIGNEERVDPSKLRQIYYDVKPNQKFSLLVHLLQNEKAGLVMVFCNARRVTDVITRGLTKAGISAVSIHGNLTQAQRKRSLASFHNQNVGVLVCTDVAARGLDIPDVSHVYNYDIPADSKQYVHRIGRTARAGKSGCAINLVSNRDYDNFDYVLREGMHIEKVDTPKFDQSNVSLDFSGASDSPRGRNGGGFSQENRGRSQGNSRGRSQNNSRGRSQSWNRGSQRTERGSNSRNENSQGNQRQSSFGNRNTSGEQRERRSFGNRSNSSQRRNSSNQAPRNFSRNK